MNRKPKRKPVFQLAPFLTALSNLLRALYPYVALAWMMGLLP